MPEGRATWPPANAAEILAPEDPYIRPEERLEQVQPVEEVPEEEPTGEDE